MYTYISDSLRKNQYKFVYVPESFHAEEHLPASLADAGRILLHIIEKRRQAEKLDENSFVPLKAKYLQDQLGWRHQTAVREALIQAGVIEVRKIFIVGELSFGYRIASPYCWDRFKRVALTTAAATRRMAKHMKKWEICPKNKTHWRLLGWLQQVQIDYEAAIETAKAICAKDTNNKRFNSLELSIMRIRDGDWHFSSDNQGRIYHNIANLKSELRQHLSINGEKLVCLDIANSQPLLFCLLMMEEEQKQQTAKLDIAQLNKASLPLPLSPHNDTHFSFYSVNPRVELFKEHCQKGTLYDHLGMPKMDIFRKIFYCRNGYHTPAKKRFGDEFPPVLDFIKMLKETDYKNAPLLLQRKEAEMIVDRIAARILKEMPDTPIITIHDCVMTTVSQAGAVKAIMLAEFAKVGLTPTIRQE